MNVLQVKTATELPGSGSVWKTAFGHSSLIRMAPECTMENIHLLGTLIQYKAASSCKVSLSFSPFYASFLFEYIIALFSSINTTGGRPQPPGQCGKQHLVIPV